MSIVIDKINNLDLFKQLAYINGKWVPSDEGLVTIVYDPATEKDIGTIPNMGQKETSSAINAASEALIYWKKLTAKDRSILLRRWHDLIIKNSNDLATIMTIEQGKPLLESIAEINYAASFVEWYAEEAKRIYGQIIPAAKLENKILLEYEPVGVVGAITPWNFPSSMITRKIAPALAAGCTVVIKPSELTPYSALALAALAEAAGIPAGVINVITGNASIIGKELTSNKKVKKISFTGSTKVGKILMAQCADNIKRLSLELGGNAPFIIFDDANIDLVVKDLLSSKFRNNGQTCICPNRIYVHKNIFDQLINKLTIAINEFKMGNGLEQVNLGPLISSEAKEKIDMLLKDAFSNGAKEITFLMMPHDKGYFYQPKIIYDAKHEMKLAKDEIFGPVLVLYKFDSDEEVIAKANDTDYGLAAYFYSNNNSRIFKLSKELEYGMIGINEIAISNEAAPFGGIKESGIGREGGQLGIMEYLNVKYLCIKIDHP